jgi:hypothetical protein
LHARHVVFNSAAYGTRTFAVDLDWQTQREEALDALAGADVVHIHQFFSLAETFGMTFEKRFGRKKIIKQYHSAPDLWAKGDAAKIGRIVTEDVAQLVIAQGPERYYPFARIVPNIIPLHDERYLPGPEAPGLPIITFSPSGRSSAWRTRWETKGVPQTLALLRKFEKAGLCRLQLLMGVPHDACLRAKRQAAIAIDECVTGNYHLSGLEALAQGKPTLGYLDSRVQLSLRRLTGALELPWIDVRLEEAQGPLLDLLGSVALRNEIGAASRRWMETHYDEHAMVEHYQRAYLDLFEAPWRFAQARLAAGRERWLSVALPEHAWTARRDASTPWRRVLKAFKKLT